MLLSPVQKNRVPLAAVALRFREGVRTLSRRHRAGAMRFNTVLRKLDLEGHFLGVEGALLNVATGWALMAVDGRGRRLRALITVPPREGNR